MNEYGYNDDTNILELLLEHVNNSGAEIKEQKGNLETVYNY
jgi:hypothetical protein